jgi:hypothetical protein
MASFPITAELGFFAVVANEIGDEEENQQSAGNADNPKEAGEMIQVKDGLTLQSFGGDLT